jgi:hypothetical protein
MQVGDLVRVRASDLRVPIGSVALIENVEDREDSRGVTTQYWARMMETTELYWFRAEWVEVLGENR